MNNLCSACQLGKSHKLSLHLPVNKSTSVLQLIFADVYGPSPFLSSDGHKYLLVFIDDFSGFTWCYPIFLKSDVANVFLQFRLLVERQFDTKIKAIQTDGGGEFQPLSSICAQLGIIHRLATPHTHEQQGKVERKHRHIVETALSIMAHSSTPSKFWHFAFETAVYLINRLPTPINNGKSPFELIFHSTLDYLFLKTFGCLCFPYLRPYNKHKVTYRSQPCIFLGYNTKHRAYRCFDRSSGRIYIARHIKFDESIFSFATQSLLGPPPSYKSNSVPWLSAPCIPQYPIEPPIHYVVSPSTQPDASPTPIPPHVLNSTPCVTSSSLNPSPNSNRILSAPSSSSPTLTPVVDLTNNSTTQQPPPSSNSPPQTVPPVQKRVQQPHTLQRTHHMQLRPNPKHIQLFVPLLYRLHHPQ